ncbi:MAG TPA: branched-chain amino acid ABC transporter ATP-binding protein/permease [Candidatus Elarobacter sp.]|jgi:branched-chain amino acid transport system permease protein|nr:branched-chain amino acid ABC transporter ATP-binding protein/permease [Candidatus Elarobacter sp.]
MRRPHPDWLILAAVVAIGLALARFGNGYQQQLTFTTGLFVVLAYGWNVISGIVGYLSFGQISFFGLGAYVAVGTMTVLHLPWYAALALAPVAAACVAFPLGAIMLRLQGVFFTLGMFGLLRIGEIVSSSIGNGAMGSSVSDVATPQQSAPIMLALAAGAFVLTRVVLNSRLGLRWMAIRDDEPAALAAGVPARPLKVQAFCLSAALAAICGVMYVWNVGYIDPSSAFSGTTELQVVLMVLVGGIGTLWGPLVGAVLISLIGQVLWARFPMQEQIVLGSITALTAVVMPGGLVALLQKRGLLTRRPVWSPLPQGATASPDAGEQPRPAAEGPALECDALTKHFGGVTAIDDVELRVARGEIVGVIGPNGAGKSTLFDAISGFTLPTRGRVLFRGADVTGRRPDVLARRGLTRTFQTSRLFPTLTVWETVVLAASCVCERRADAVACAHAILVRAGLLDVWKNLPESLPPGRQRLLEIARALALRPSVLLLDEAMAGMTPVEIGQVHELLRQAVRGGCAVVAIEHVLPAIARIADRVYVLDFGRIIAQGPPRVVFDDPVVLDAYIGVGPSALDEVAASVV